MKLEDVQANWNKFGETDPLWGILAWPDKSENRWQVDAFFETGVEEIEAVLAYTQGLGLAIEYGTALDFGCAVGRLSQALARHFKTVHGVDISSAMIERAREYNQFGERCVYHLNLTDDLRLFPDRSFDFIYSNITLQHMPPRFAAAYIQEFLRLLAPDGTLIFQIPDSPKRMIRRLFQPLRPTRLWRSYQKWRYGDQPVMDMYGTPRAQIEQLVKAHGGNLVDVQADESADAAWISYRYCVTKTS
jgi:SAM-dependent methyltransferase